MTMTPEELSRCDGRDGRKACVAVSGKIYDVTTSPLWQDGVHQGLHQAGADLTEALQQAPHVRAVIERFPVIGEVTQPVVPAAGGGLKYIVIVAIVVAALASFFLLRS
jgi:predicted heme/steroid binding protein